MKIAILSRGPSLYSTKRFLEEGKKLGHDTHVINYAKSHMALIDGKPSINLSKAKFTFSAQDFDAILPRIGASMPFYGSAVVRQFETMKVFSLNSALGITRARDKIRSLQILARKGLPIPNTAFAHSPSDIEGVIESVGGAPLIIKLLEGAQGSGVVLAETKQAAKSVIQAFWRIDANIIIQEFIKESSGSDLRCVVLGNKVIASMKRQSKGDDFRSNIHAGGSCEKVILSPEEERIAIESAQALNLHFSGVDILRTNRGPLVIEVNASPGLEGIESCTGINVAEQVIKYIEKEYKRQDKDYQG